MINLMTNLIDTEVFVFLSSGIRLVGRVTDVTVDETGAWLTMDNHGKIIYINLASVASIDTLAA